jgi:hypothetical protein
MSDTAATDEAFLCPLTHDIMREPVIDIQGISYEKTAILKWLETSHTSPVTRMPLTSSQLTPNRALKDLISQKHPNLSPLAPPPERVVQYDANIAVQVFSTELDGKRYVMVNLEPPEQPNAQGHLGRQPVDVVCVIDVSGSMGQDATLPGSSEQTGLNILDLVKHSTRTIIHTLGDGDRLGIVTFTDTAEIVCPLTNMTEQGKTNVQAKVEALEDLNSTNIYDGLVKALQVLQDGNSKDGCVLLLTDGMPNVEPPRGTLAGFMKLRDGFTKPDFCKSISTFGFGYNLDSLLMSELAKTWSSSGSFSFIPDSGMVGTVFVNSLGNILSRISTEVSINVEGEAKLMNSIALNVKPTSWGWNVSALLQYGQSKQLVLEASGEPLAVTVKSTNQPELTITETVARDEAVIANISMAKLRNEFCQVLGQILYLNSWFDGHVDMPEECRGLIGGTNPENLEKSTLWVNNLAEKIKTSPAFVFPETKEQAAGLLQDVEGQVAQAVSRLDWYQKWGRHYLVSLQRAHLLQECNNFKDAGVQVYGGQVFEKIRDGCDEVFVALPPPTPRARAQHSSGMPLPISMGRYYDPNNPCFSGHCKVSMADGSFKRVQDVCKGDLVKSGTGVSRVECVIKTWCDNGVALLCKVGQCRLTPWHPIFVDEWKFPCELSAPKWTICEAVYSFVLDGASVLEVGGYSVVALGHGMSDNERLVSAFGVGGHLVWRGSTRIIGHGYFGSQQVLRDLSSISHDGLIEFKHGCMLRDANHQVVGLDRSKLVRFEAA